MAKYYGDIPCVKQNGIVHITMCATECLCGQKWSYSRPSNFWGVLTIILG